MGYSNLELSNLSLFNQTHTGCESGDRGTGGIRIPCGQQNSTFTQSDDVGRLIKIGRLTIFRVEFDLK